MKLSCIIPTGNSFNAKGGSIRHTILGLLHQIIAPQIIIVHNGKKDDYQKLSEFLLTYQLDKKINLFYSPGSNIPQSRNIGAKNADGDFLIFLDDDTILCESDIISLLNDKIEPYDFALGAKRYWTRDQEWFLKNNDLLLSKMVHVEENQTFLDLFKSHISFGLDSHRNNGGEFLLSRTFIGSFGVIRKEVFFKSGQFPENFDSFDDDIIVFNLLHLGYQGASLFNKSVIHINHMRNNDNNGEDVCFPKFIDYISQQGNPDYCSLEEMKKLEQCYIL